MKKTYLLIVTFFLTWWMLFLISCQNEISSTETINFVFPEWPPQEQLSYPPLDCWLVQIEGPDFSKKFYTHLNSLVISLEKNIPYAITITPVTQGKIFFKPAGTIYPYYVEQNNQQNITWEGGYSATLMQYIYRSKIDTGITSQHIQEFQKSFNWKKLQDNIQKKCQNEEDRFYNPWQLETQTLLENLCYASFSANFLNTKNIITLPLQEAGFTDKEQKLLLSSYIPENLYIQNKGILTLRKNQNEMFMYNQIYAAEINCSSSKKVSVAFTYLPILYKSYENLK